MQTLDPSAYLARIGYTGNTAPTAETLRALQFQHLRTVPYENLDILRGIPLSLETADLYDKIVTRGRGGFCFELNALFGWLLRALGFQVTDYFARFLLDEPAIPIRRHQVLGVTVPGAGERYSADVGVGSTSPNFPVRLEAGTPQPQGNGIAFRYERGPLLGWVLHIQKKGEWKRLYSFTEEPQLPIDYTATTFYCEKHPASPFNKTEMVALRTETGRYTLDGNTFKCFDGDDVKTWEEPTAEAKAATLKSIFGITW